MGECPQFVDGLVDLVAEVVQHRAGCLVSASLEAPRGYRYADSQRGEALLDTVVKVLTEALAVGVPRPRRGGSRR